MKRLEMTHRLKMALGWLCYWPVMVLPTSSTGMRGWALGWAGYYAYADRGALNHDHHK